MYRTSVESFFIFYYRKKKTKLQKKQLQIVLHNKVRIILLSIQMVFYCISFINVLKL